MCVADVCVFVGAFCFVWAARKRCVCGWLGEVCVWGWLGEVCGGGWLGEVCVGVVGCGEVFTVALDIDLL